MITIMEWLSDEEMTCSGLSSMRVTDLMKHINDLLKNDEDKCQQQ